MSRLAETMVSRLKNCIFIPGFFAGSCKSRLETIGSAIQNRRLLAKVLGSAQLKTTQTLKKSQHHGINILIRHDLRPVGPVGATQRVGWARQSPVIITWWTDPLPRGNVDEVPLPLNPRGKYGDDPHTSALPICFKAHNILIGQLSNLNIRPLLDQKIVDICTRQSPYKVLERAKRIYAHY